MSGAISANGNNGSLQSGTMEPREKLVKTGKDLPGENPPTHSRVQTILGRVALLKPTYKLQI